jgi:Membrane-fusion protein
MIKFLKKPIGIISIIVILGLAALGYVYFGGEEKLKFDVAIAKRADLIQEVSVTGRVKPARSVELAFEKGGKVVAVYANVGRQIQAGQTLVVLENAELAAQLAQAEATLEKDQAKLAEFQRGTRPEEIQVQEVKVANAKFTLEDAKKNLVDKLQDAYTKSDDAVMNRVDQFFSNPKSSSPQLSFLVSTDSQLESDIEWQRLLLQNVFKSWRSSLDKLTISNDLAAYVSEAEINLNQINYFSTKPRLQ